MAYHVTHLTVRGDGFIFRGAGRVQAAAASGSAAEGGPAELDLATTIASFPPEVREEVLLGASEDILAQLPPAILAEAHAPARAQRSALRRHRHRAARRPLSRSAVHAGKVELAGRHAHTTSCTIGRIQ